MGVGSGQDLKPDGRSCLSRCASEYEPEGFVLDDGTTYLPDFLLHGLEGRCKGDLYVEVKGHMTDEDMHKVREFSKHKPIYIVTDIPVYKGPANPEPHWYEEMESKCYTWPYPYNFETVDGDHFGAFLGINLHGNPELFGDDCNYLADAHTYVMNAAFEAASTARFEHGDSPEKSYGYDYARDVVQRLRRGCQQDSQRNQQAKNVNKKRLQVKGPYNDEKLQLVALLNGDVFAKDHLFARKMLDKKWPGWRDTDLSVEQVYALKYRKDGQAAKPSYASHFEHR